MEEPTTTSFGQLAREFNRSSTPKVQRNSETWKAIKLEIEQMINGDHLPALRNRNLDHGRTQYARGAMDALESLLRFGGEDV